MKRRRTKLHFWCKECKKFTVAEYEYGRIVTKDDKDDDIEEVECSPYDLKEFNKFGEYHRKCRDLVCEYCGSEVEYIDNLMVESIDRLNSIGIETKFCCSGHNKGDMIYIAFTRSGSHILVYNINLLYESFHETIKEYPDFSLCVPKIKYEPYYTLSGNYTVQDYVITLSGKIFTRNAYGIRTLYDDNRSYEEIRDLQNEYVKTCNVYFHTMINKLVQKLLSKKCYPH